MNNSEKIFMLVVEEMSFTKAAQKAFLTQQCISEHIKKLETEYGVALFERRPKLSLTQAGQSMYKAMQQIQNMRTSLELTLKEIARGSVGNIRVGINSSRARAIMPVFFKAFHTKYPNVSVAVFSDDTSVMVEMLTAGKLDIVVGVDAISTQVHKITPLVNDMAYLVISNQLLMTAIGNNRKYIQYKNSFASGGIDLSLLKNVPFVRNYPTSTMYKLIERHIHRKGITLNTIFSVSDYDTQLQLCASHQAAGFLPASLCRGVFKYNEHCQNENDFINIFPIEGMSETLRVECITLGLSYTPMYIKDFIFGLQKQIIAESMWIEQNLTI